MEEVPWNVFALILGVLIPLLLGQAAFHLRRIDGSLKELKVVVAKHDLELGTLRSHNVVDRLDAHEKDLQLVNVTLDYQRQINQDSVASAKELTNLVRELSKEIRLLSNSCIAHKEREKKG